MPEEITVATAPVSVEAAQAQAQELKMKAQEIAIDLNQAHIISADGVIFQVLDAAGRYDDSATRSLYSEAHPEMSTTPPAPLAGLRVYRAGGVVIDAQTAVEDHAEAVSVAAAATKSAQAIVLRAQQDSEAAATVAAQITAEAAASGLVQDAAPVAATPFFSATPQ